MDVTEAVAAKTQRVRAVPESVIADVKCTFPLKRWVRVTVRHGHFDEGQAPRNRPTIKLQIVQNDPFAVIKADTKRPFLPFDEVPEYAKRGSVGLYHVQSLGNVGAPDRLQETISIQQVAMVIVGQRRNLRRVDVQPVDFNQFPGVQIHNGDDINRVRILQQRRGVRILRL